MTFYQAPIPFLAVLFLISLFASFRNIFSPAVVLSGLYLLVSVASLAVDSNRFTHATPGRSPAVAMAGFTALLLISLIPSLFIRRPTFATVQKPNAVVLVFLWSAGMLGLFAFAFLLKYALASSDLNAFSVRELQQTLVLKPSPLLTLAVIPAAFFPLYGLILFSPVGQQAGFILKLGLFAGFASYALNDLCHRGRDWVLQYLFLSLFYLWLFVGRWSRKTKLYALLIAILMLSFGTFYVSRITDERFGESGTGLGVAAGTIDYFGQQPYVFSEIVSDTNPPNNVSEFIFPLPYLLLGKDPVSPSDYLAKRTKPYQYAFGTFLGSFYMVGGWPGLSIFVLVAASIFFMLFSSNWVPVGSLGYPVAVLLYYQFMFQGAFYWMLYGRSGNCYILVLITIAFASMFRIPGRRTGVAQAPRL